MHTTSFQLVFPNRSRRQCCQLRVARHCATATALICSWLLPLETHPHRPPVTPTSTRWRSTWSWARSLVSSQNTTSASLSTMFQRVLPHTPSASSAASRSLQCPARRSASSDVKQWGRELYNVYTTNTLSLPSSEIATIPNARSHATISTWESSTQKPKLCRGHG